jgi:hypothetical protein
MVATVDAVELETKVKEMYRHVAQEPGGDYHFELGERLALRVGYDADRLRNVPAGAVESFAGVGFFFDPAALTSGEAVVDLGRGQAWTPFTLPPSWDRWAGSSATTSPSNSSRRPANSPPALERVTWSTSKVALSPCR